MSTTLNATFALPRRGSTGPGALQVSLNHVWRLSDAVLIHPGLPRMDRLAGDSGASPRHELNLRLDARRGPLGGSLGIRWKDSYRLRFEGGRDGARDLKVGAMSASEREAQLRFRFNWRGPLVVSLDAAQTGAWRDPGARYRQPV
ncbi:hypothetical protein ACRAWD_31620 [Caulobacter segnis]